MLAGQTNDLFSLFIFTGGQETEIIIKCPKIAFSLFSGELSKWK